MSRSAQRVEDNFRRDRPRDPGRVPVAALVAGERLDDPQAAVGQRLLAGEDLRVRRAAALHAVGDRLQVLLIGLPEIDREAVDFEPLLAQPVGDRAAVEAT